MRAQFGGRKPRCFAAHHRHARGECAHAARDAVGLAVDDTDIRIVDTERVGTDLRDDRLNALADGGDAGDDLHRAVRLQLSMRTVSNGPSPLFSTNIAKPAPTVSPFLRRLRRLS